MKLKIILITLLVSAVCVGLLFTLSFKKDNSNEICKQLVIKIEPIGEKNYVSKEMVVNLLNSRELNPENKKRANIDLVKIRETIEKSFAVKQAKCYLTKDNNFKIEITPRTPFFKVLGKKNYYVEDDDKRTIFTTAPDFNANVPIVKGIFHDSIAQKEIFDFIKFLKNDDFLSKLITKIYYENGVIKFIQNRDFLLKLVVDTYGENNFLNFSFGSSSNNPIVIVGKLKNNEPNNDYAKKLNRLKEFYFESIINQYNFGKYSEIDLSFDKQIVCR